MGHVRLCTAAAVLTVVMTACGGGVEGTSSAPPPSTLLGAEQGNVDAQRSAAAFAEAVVIEPNDAYAPACTGVLVAPRVILTAAHCVAFTRGSFTVTAPHARGGAAQSLIAASGEPMDAAFRNYTPDTYQGRGLRDVGAVYLDAPFTNVLYASLASSAFNASSDAPPIWVSSVGRSIDGSTGALALSLTGALGAPTDGNQLHYTTTRLAADGESGGPLFVEGTHDLVGVHAGRDPAAPSVDTWARLDGDVYTWITQKVASRGGWYVRGSK